MGTKHSLRIATRESALAAKQAELVNAKLVAKGVEGAFVFIKSKGDLSQERSVPNVGGSGVFTKAIDDAVLDGRADVGVHSLKDLPTMLHPDLILAAVLERENSGDVIVFRENDFLKHQKYKAIVATGSVRRKAQWLNKFPYHDVVPVRGNVDSRLKKLQQNNWDGMILALAGLKRLDLNPNYKLLDWMVPAPGQGAIAIVARKDDNQIIRLLSGINHELTFASVSVERQFLHSLGAGCSAAVGGLAWIENGKMFFKGEILTPDGKEKIEVELNDEISNAKNIGQRAAEIAKQKGAEAILKVSL